MNSMFGRSSQINNVPVSFSQDLRRHLLRHHYHYQHRPQSSPCQRDVYLIQIYTHTRANQSIESDEQGQPCWNPTPSVAMAPPEWRKRNQNQFREHRRKMQTQQRLSILLHLCIVWRHFKTMIDLDNLCGCIPKHYISCHWYVSSSISLLIKSIIFKLKNECMLFLGRTKCICYSPLAWIYKCIRN